MLKSLKIINKVISLFLILISIYISFLFVWPEINLLAVKAYDDTNGYVYKSRIAELKGIDDEKLREAPKENRIIIPKIMVDGIILEGQDKETLKNGIWRRPNTFKPGENNNTVLTAHRFLSNHGPNTFYHLDNLKIEDDILIFWEGKEYLYKINEIFEVKPEQVEIEDETDEEVLTLYTCTPLYSADKRLVVRAKLVEFEESK